MAFNGSGLFVRLYNWVSDRNANIKIRADRMDAEMDGIATGLSNCITRDGQSTVTADIPFNNKRLTGVADATDDTDALNRQTADARYVIVDSVSAEYTVSAGLPTPIPLDGSTPQNTEGVQILSASITPKSVTNKIRATVTIQGTVGTTNTFIAALFRNATAGALRSAAMTVVANYLGTMVFRFEDVPGSVSAQTYYVRAGSISGVTAYVNYNGVAADPLGANGMGCMLVLEEIKA